MVVTTTLGRTGLTAARSTRARSARDPGLLTVPLAAVLPVVRRVSVVLALASCRSFAAARRDGMGVAALVRAHLLGAEAIAGLDYEVRGEIPPGGVLVAAKHMSMWDTMALYLLLDDPAIVVKRELLSIPFYGWYRAQSRR